MDKKARILELQTIPRVPLPPDVPDDDHNRIGGLLEMIEEYFPPTALIMELGTGMGVSTEVFALLCAEVHTTDTWSEGLQSWKNAFEEMAKNYKNIRQYYEDCDVCVKRFPDEIFDAVYIDEFHYYENVKKDIEKWLPKVKPGGILCGHDYIERPQYDFGVIRAVNEAFGKPFKVYKDTSWMIFKKKKNGWPIERTSKCEDVPASG